MFGTPTGRIEDIVVLTGVPVAIRATTLHRRRHARFTNKNMQASESSVQLRWLARADKS